MFGTPAGRRRSLLQPVQTAHEQSDLIDRGFRRRHRRRQGAEVDHREAIGNDQQFVQILRDHDNGGAALGQSEQGLMDGGGGSGIDAPGRLGDNQHLGTLQDFASDDELLLVAARQGGGIGVGASGFDVEFGDDSLGIGRLPPGFE